MNETTEDGYVLVETIVSFTILSLVLTTMYAAIAATYRQRAAVSLKREALMIAESTFANADISPKSGQSPSGLSWNLKITPGFHNNLSDNTAGCLCIVSFTATNKKGVQVFHLRTTKFIQNP